VAIPAGSGLGSCAATGGVKIAASITRVRSTIAILLNLDRYKAFPNALANISYSPFVLVLEGNSS